MAAMLGVQVGAEMELLLFCIQPGVHPHMRLAALLRNRIDWVEVFRLGLLHGSLPALYQRASAEPTAGIPAATLAELCRYARKNTARNQELTAELHEVIQLLHAANIEAVPFKGPTLAARLYRDPSIRQFGDLDILVRRGDVCAAEDVLRSRGYLAWQELSREQEARCLRKGKDRPFVSRDGAFAVEIHWRFTPGHYPFAMDAEMLWPRLKCRYFAGTSVLGIPDEEMLLLLCVHGTRHQWSSLKWVCDVAALIAVERGLNWEYILQEAERMGIRRMLWIGLLLANGLMESCLPEEVSHKIGDDPVAVRLARLVARDIFGAAGHNAEGASVYAFQVAARERLPDRLRILLRFVLAKMEPTDRDRAASRISGRFRFASYLLPPARLLHRSGFRALWRLLASSRA